MSGAQITGEPDLESLAQWPKLFRRLVSFFSGGATGLGGFDTWLRSSPSKDDNLWMISRAEYGNMHDIIKVSGKEIKMLLSPSDVVIVPR